MTLPKPALFLLLPPLFCPFVAAQDSGLEFAWPNGAKAALSLSFDDARPSQIDAGTELLERLDAKVTFYVVPSRVEERLPGWIRAAESGHEIANHSLTHPCTGNFLWSREGALEEHTLETMRADLVEANRRLKVLLGIDATHFAYPCGQTFVGRGRDTKSYVPLIAELFASGRTWLDETAVDPAFVDLAQVTGVEMDGKEFDEIKALIEEAKKLGQWLVLAGHEIGESGNQTTRIKMLEELIPYAKDPDNKLWFEPVGTVAEYIAEKRR